MKLRVARNLFMEKSTGGLLTLDDVFFCYTLEDKDRKLEAGGKKIAGETAIPRGTYEVKITYSNRFKRPMPLVVGVPGFEGVRIHPGNTAADTQGCILVGETRGAGVLMQSVPAYERLFARLEKAKGPIVLEVV